MSSEQLITKRLHVSGLTPALTADGISQRLSSFGTVKAVDGFDLSDGVGRPRKFGYVTIETTASKFARCCNSLSGTTWKGAKLRIGEAKPDFRERIAAENVAAKREAEIVDEKRRARKLRRLGKYGAVHAKDMSLVTKENAPRRSGWVVTPLGRIVRPMRMKPPRPLTSTDPNNEKGKGKIRKKKGNVEVRARRRKIDMLKHGSVHLKGVFVDVTLPEVVFSGKNSSSSAVGEDDNTMEETDESERESEEMEEDDEHTDSGKEESEEPDDLEDTPMILQEQPEDVGHKKATSSNTNKLKDLFTPQEEDAGFSLLGHLDLDLELDEDIPFFTTNEDDRPPQAPQTTESAPISLPTRAQGQTWMRNTSVIQLNPKQPLFFPLRSSSTLGPVTKGRQRDPFDMAKEKGWNWRDPTVAFYRTETEDEIRKRWEGVKGELTREWKRRWREAGKINRRKYGGVRPDGD